MKTAVEMTGHGRGGKPKAGFLRAHSPWKSLRDSHIPTAATKQWKSGKPKAGFPLSHCLLFSFYDQIQKGGLAAELRSLSSLIVRLENAGSVRCGGLPGIHS